jgi:hypothetical protein
MDDDENVIQFGKAREEREANEVPAGKDNNPFPVDDYVVVDIDNQEWYGTGFLVFTPDHVAIMKSGEKMAIPSLVMPIGRVKAAFLEEEASE